MTQPLNKKAMTPSRSERIELAAERSAILQYEAGLDRWDADWNAAQLYGVEPGELKAYDKEFE